MFWVSLIKVLSAPTEKSLISLGGNCTLVDNNYWIMEGDIECLVDDGVELKVLTEGTVDSLGGLSRNELKKVCVDYLGFNIEKD